MHPRIAEQYRKFLGDMAAVPEEQRRGWPYIYEEGGFDGYVARQTARYERISALLSTSDDAVEALRDAVTRACEYARVDPSGLHALLNTGEIQWPRSGINVPPAATIYLGRVRLEFRLVAREEAEGGVGRHDNTLWISRWVERWWSVVVDDKEILSFRVKDDNITPLPYYDVSTTTSSVSDGHGAWAGLSVEEARAEAERLRGVSTTILGAIQDSAQNELASGAVVPGESEEDARWRVLSYCESYGVPTPPPIEGVEWDYDECGPLPAEVAAKYRKVLHLFDNRTGQRLTRQHIAEANNDRSGSGLYVHITTHSWERPAIEKVLADISPRFVVARWVDED